MVTVNYRGVLQRTVPPPGGKLELGGGGGGKSYSVAYK